MYFQNLSDAVWNGDILHVQHLIASGDDVNAESEDAITPLFLAITKKHYDMVKLLLDSGADVNHEIQKKDSTPLLYAIGQKQKDIVELLLDRGADVNHEIMNRLTPIIFAIGEEQNDIAVVELLLKKGANINYETTDGNTPLLSAIRAKQKDIVELFLDRGADVNHEIKKGWTPLLYAIEQKQKDIAELFLDRGADVNHENMRGRTPLFYSIEQKQKDIAELFLDRGADVNHETITGWTPLLYAIEQKQKDIVELLLQKGADVNAKTIYGNTPLKSAITKGLHDIQVLLRSYKNKRFYSNPQNTNDVTHYRATDGHMVRSRAELVIDNWLYTNRIFHEYEKYLPVTEKVLSDFYIPEQDIYIEFWGLENDSQYNARKKEKLKIYHKYQFRLLELHDSDLLNLEDNLSSKLREFANNKLQKRSYKPDGEMDDARRVALKQKPLHKIINLNSDTDDDIPF